MTVTEKGDPVEEIWTGFVSRLEGIGLESLL